MSAAPKSDSTKSFKKFLDCFSCRVLSGGGLIAAAAYVYFETRRAFKMRGPTAGTAAQVTFAAALASLGAVILYDPVGKIEKKS